MNALSFSIEDLVSICQATLRQGKTTQVTRLVIDSRHITDPASSVFIAIVGDKHNGHRFIQEAYEKGVRAFLLSEESEYLDTQHDATVLTVTDTLLSFQKIAAAHRAKYNLPVVAISGSNGKTIIKEWLNQLLSSDFNIVKSPGSYNSQVGVPISVCNIGPEHNLGIFEAGISLPDEMAKLESVIQPQIGIFSNIGPAHDENFINTGQKVAEKLNLFVNCQDLIYCSDHYDIGEKLYASGLNRKINLFSWGSGPDNKIVVGKYEYNGSYTIVSFEYNGQQENIQIPFSDQASVENVMHCVSFMLLKNYSLDVIRKRLLVLTPVKMRLETKEGINGCAIINDSYNSDINSLGIALDFLEKNKRFSHKTLILSDILQSGKTEKALAAEIADMLSKRDIDRFIGIGPVLQSNAPLFDNNSEFFASTDEFLRNIDPGSFQNEIILLKGARKFEFEQISHILEAKVHNTVLEVDFNALTENLNFFRSKLSPDTKLMVMVKAFAYGSGVYEIANHLQYHRVDYMAVAYTDEGIELRRAGITTPVMVMSPEEEHLYFLLKYNLEPEIYSFRILKKLFAVLRQWKDGLKEPLPIHIKYDTGMHRLGFRKEDTAELVQIINENKDLIQVSSAFSHFSARDEAEHDEYSRKQIAVFEDVCTQLESKLGYKIMKHIANSSAILRFPQAQFDMVRLGIGLYGVDESSYGADLADVLTFKTHIIQIRELQEGESVGYSRKAISQNKRRIATISVGYADGFQRIMGNGNWQVLLHGKKAAITGNVCMDMCMIDVTNIPEAQEGDEVLLFGEGNSLKDYAKAMNTIAYEALTSVSERVKRVYIQHGS